MCAEKTEPLASTEHRIEIDWNEVGSLTEKERNEFTRVANILEKGGYFSPTGRPDKEWAFIDLSEYPAFAHYQTACKKYRKGDALYQTRKAERLAYYTKFFNPRTHVADIVAVNRSAPERQGGRMAQHYFAPVEERGGYPSANEPEARPAQCVIWNRHFGVFRAAPGHRQGDVVVDEEMVAYIILRRCAEFAFYGTILGHADHLKSGVMYKMHLDLMKYLFEEREKAASGDISVRGLRYIFYARYFQKEAGILLWKKKMRFRPGLFTFDYRRSAAPASGSG